MMCNIKGRKKFLFIEKNKLFELLKKKTVMPRINLQYPLMLNCLYEKNFNFVLKLKIALNRMVKNKFERYL